MNLKHLIVSLFLISTITNCSELQQDSKEQIMQKIRQEYESCELVKPAIGESPYVKVNSNNNSTLFNMILKLAERMNINISGFKIEIIRAIEEDKIKLQKFGITGPTTNAELVFDKWLYIGEELIKILNYDELEAVIAHELSHAKFQHNERAFTANAEFNKKFNLPTLISLLALYKLQYSNKKKVFIAFDIQSIFYFISMVKRNKLKQQNEYEADIEAMKYIKDKNNLINGIKKLEDFELDCYNKNKANKVKSFKDHLYKKTLILNKYFYKFKILNTHPSLENRAKNLERLNNTTNLNS